MLLQSLQTPRKVNDLGSGVAAGALLAGHGLAALISARPPRLALQSIDGAAAAVIDLSVEAVKDVALLSKDAAVVLGESGVVWGLLDLRGSIKARPVARDVRALCARPTGESAFAISEDGKGLSLTLSRQDIGLRSFALRGALHACDVGEQVTYAVVDTPAGRQLHVHPGATPELGTSVRATLPEGAAALDRVRGSQSLSALFKRGEERICVVTGTAKLEAKLVRLDTKPADVAALDGWLIVATLDGRLALYDPEALAAAGDEALAPSGSIALHAHGRPRVLLAGSHKGVPSVWVGTTAGEVICASGTLQMGELERPAASIPRPSTADLTAQVAVREREIEALRAEMEQLKVALEAQSAAHREANAEREAAHAKALEEHSAAHRQANAEREAAHAKALEEHSAAHRQASDEREAAHAKALEEHSAAHAGALEEQSAAHRQTAEGRDAAHAKALQEQSAAHKQALDECDAAHVETLEERDAAHAKALEAQSAAHRQALDERDAAHAQAAGDARDQHAKAEERASALDMELDARTTERDRARGELDAARTTLVAAEEQIRSLASELEDRTKAYDELRAEVGRLMGDLSKERERIEKIFPFGKDGLTSIERARDKVEGVLAQIQSVVFKRPGD